MNRATWRQHRWVQTFRGVPSRWERRELSGLDAAEIPGCPEPQFRRYRTRYEAEGVAGLADKRFGRASAKRVPADEFAWVPEEYRAHHMGWKHVREHLRLASRYGPLERGRYRAPHGVAA